MGALEFKPTIKGAPSKTHKIRIAALVDLANRVLDERIGLEGKFAGQDDHVKNIAFLMDKRGKWHLSPAFDVAYSYNPSGAWTSRHEMSLNGKRGGFQVEDLVAFARTAGLKKARAMLLFKEVADSAKNWRRYAKAAGVFAHGMDRIEKAFRIHLAP